MKIREFYDKIAAEYSDVTNHPTTAAARVREAELTNKIVSEKSYGTVIDIGCADSEFLRTVNAQSKIGIDISVEMIRLNSEQTPEGIYIL